MLKKQLTAVAGIDPSQDISHINEKFSVEAEPAFLDAKKWFMAALKDTDDNACLFIHNYDFFYKERACEASII